jgi:hypothetical protein
MAYKPKPEFKGQKDSRKVKVVSFAYMGLVPDPADPDRMVLHGMTANFGEEISLDELSDADLEKGERLEAFYTDAELKGDEEESVATEEVPDLSTMGEFEISEYIHATKPNVDETVAIAGNDPELAKRVLEAENIATGNDPRTGVEKGLLAIIERANQ